MAPRRRRITAQLYRAARVSDNARAATRGPGAYAKHPCGSLLRHSGSPSRTDTRCMPRSGRSEQRSHVEPCLDVSNGVRRVSAEDMIRRLARPHDRGQHASHHLA